MSDYSDVKWPTEMERKAFLKLEQWLIAIVGRRLNLEEQYIGTALIMDLRRAMGLPLVAGARDFDREELMLGPAAQSLNVSPGGKLLPWKRKP